VQIDQVDGQLVLRRVQPVEVLQRHVSAQEQEL
jgi:hypothetical protein